MSNMEHIARQLELQLPLHLSEANKITLDAKGRSLVCKGPLLIEGDKNIICMNLLLDEVNELNLEYEYRCDVGFIKLF